MKTSIRSSDDVKSSLHTEALKLADEWDWMTEEKLAKWGDDTQAMIRRLVEELDEKNYRILELTKRYKALTWSDKQTKPEDIWTSCLDCGKRVTGDSIHTCSPQTKPLSDEEIWKLHDKHIDWIPCGHSEKVIGFVEFARAIEERHGIK